MDTFTVSDLDTARLLTDAFKLKLLEAFAGGPVTTKQVADRMGEKAPRLYRHVDALAAAGLLTLVEERPKRGTVERYYRTVADRFEIDPGLFSPGDDAQDEFVDMLRTLLRDTESDLVRCVAHRQDGPRDAADLPLVMKVSIRASRAEIDRLRARLEEWLDECRATNDLPDRTGDDVSYSGLLAFYPQTAGED